MGRTIKLEYDLMKKDNFNKVYITLFEENLTSVSIKTGCYNLKNKVNGELYNEILDDLDAEFDNDLAMCIEKLVDKIFKEVE